MTTKEPKRPLSGRDKVPASAKKRCPQEETAPLELRLSDFGFDGGPLRDDFCVTFREPTIAALRSPRRVSKLGGRRAVSASLDEDRLGEAAPPRVYENTFADFYDFARPDSPEARLPYSHFRERLLSVKHRRRSCRLCEPVLGIDEVIDQRVSRPGVVVAHISYPVSNPAWFVFDCSAPATFGLLAFAHAIAYQLTYAMESGQSGACAAGKLGIWGHGIGDLVYNGISRVSVHGGDVVFADFSCDS